MSQVTSTASVQSLNDPLFNDYLGQVQRNGCDLRHMPPHIQDEPYIVMTAVKQNGLALEFASNYIRTQCKDIILAAVENNGFAINYVLGDLKEDPEIKSRCLRWSPSSRQFEA